MPTPEQEIRQQGADLFDEMSIPLLQEADPEVRESLRRMFAEGYLQGHAAGAVSALLRLVINTPTKEN